MSGKEDKNVQLQKIKLISVTLLVSHLDISGKNDKEIQEQKVPNIKLTLLVLNLDISGKIDNFEQLKNINLYFEHYQYSS